MRYLILIFLLSSSILNASEVKEAMSILENSKKTYALELENANSNREKLLAEYALLQGELKEAQSKYEKAKSESMSVESLEDKLSFLEKNFAKLQSQGESLDASLFNLDSGEVNEEKLFAFPQRYIPREQMKEEVIAFYSGERNTLPVDLSESKVFKAKAKSFVEKFKLGGVWVYPITFFAFISTFIALLKFVEIIALPSLAKADLDEFSALMKSGQCDKAKVLSKRFSKPYKIMLKELFADSKLAKNLLEEVSYENMLKVGDKLHRGLGFISVTASVAPLLGLLGTVTGIIKTFSDLAIYGNANPNLLSSGISEALISTEYGLSLAIPAFILYAYLSRRARRVLSDMEKLASIFISSTKA